MEKGIIGKALIIGAVEGLIINALESTGKVVKEHAEDYLKANVFNIGTNDEELYLLARAYALEKKWVTVDELNKITRVLDAYETSQRRRIVGMLGKREGDGSIDTPSLDGAGNAIVDNKTGEVVMTKTSFKTNVAGAKIIAMLGKMTEGEIKNELDSSGASASFMVGLNKKATATVTAVQSSQIKQDGDTLFTRETWLERMAREANQRRGII